MYKPHFPRNAHGFTLPEALISVLILGISLVGIAVMQKQTVKNHQANELKAIAITQIGNMIDRMRANIAGVRSGYYDNITGIPNDIPPLCVTPCDSQQIATRDAYYWNTSNAVLLPNGHGTVFKNNAQYWIILRWNGENKNASNTECMDAQNCMSIGVSL